MIPSPSPPLKTALNLTQFWGTGESLGQAVPTFKVLRSNVYSKSALPASTKLIGHSSTTLSRNAETNSMSQPKKNLYIATPIISFLINKLLYF